MVILKDNLLEFLPDTKEIVRKQFNLDEPGRMDEAIDIIDEWIKKQEHFIKKDFPREYIERTLILSKGQTERAKHKIERLCTYKTLMPEFFKPIGKEDYTKLLNFIYHSHVPKMTSDHCRIYIARIFSVNFTSDDFMNFYRYVIMLNEYIKKVDYNNGVILIYDFREIDIMSFLTKISPTTIRQAVTLTTEAYSLRIKSVNLLSNSKTVDLLIGFFKQVFTSKLGDRIHLHKNIESLYEYAPKEQLPVEYGGKEKALKTLNEEALEVLTAQEFSNYFSDMCKAGTDESRRRTDKFNEDYMGVPGSFRMLRVD